MNLENNFIYDNRKRQTSTSAHDHENTKARK